MTTTLKKRRLLYSPREWDSGIWHWFPSVENDITNTFYGVSPFTAPIGHRITYRTRLQRRLYGSSFDLNATYEQFTYYLELFPILEYRISRESTVTLLLIYSVCSSDEMWSKETPLVIRVFRNYWFLGKTPLQSCLCIPELDYQYACTNRQFLHKVTGSIPIYFLLNITKINL